MVVRTRRSVVLLLVMVCLAAGHRALAQSTRAATSRPDGIRLTLVHINDPHGQLEGRTKNGKPFGGYARLSTYVDAVRSAGEADRVMLIHAGDEFSKADALTNATKGRANIAILNLLKLDLWVPGNGEYYGGVKVLRERMAEARFKVLSADVAEKDGKLLAEPYCIENVGEAKVAFLGLGYMHAPQVAQTGLVLSDPVQIARKLVPELRQKADVVVAVTHIGLDADVKLVQAVSGLDLVIGGHSHSVLPKGRLVKNPDGREVLVCQTGEFLTYAGRVDLRLEKVEGRWVVAEAKARLDPLDETVKLDPRVTALIAREAATTRPAAVPAASGSPKRTREHRSSPRRVLSPHYSSRFSRSLLCIKFGVTQRFWSR